MIEALAKKIGYKKIKAFVTTNDMDKLKQFIDKTGLRVKVYKNQAEILTNSIDAVPVTIVTMADSRQVRFDGYAPQIVGASPITTGSVGSVANQMGGLNASGMPQIPGSAQQQQGGSQCSSK